MIVIYFMIGSVAVMAQEGQIIKEIKVTNTIKNVDIPNRFPDPILLFEGNKINLKCVVNPTLNYSIQKAYLNISRSKGGVKPTNFDLDVIHGKDADSIDQTVPWILPDVADYIDGTYVAEMDIVTTNSSTPDAGAYVSMNMAYAGTPVIFKFEDVNSNEKFDEGTDRLLRGWQFTVVDVSDDKVKVPPITPVTGDDGAIRLDPAAVGSRYKITEQAAGNWISIPPEKLEDNVFTVEREREGNENELYFANRLKPATLVLIKYEDRNGNGRYDDGEGLPNWKFQVASIDGPAFSETVETDARGRATVTEIPFLSDEGTPEDNPAQRYSITEVSKSGWVSVPLFEMVLHPGEDLSGEPRLVENKLLGGRITVHKFEDLNGNGKYDPGEGCSGWTFTVTGQETDLRAVTDENGAASFDIRFASDPASPNELPRETYVIHEEPKTGWAEAPDQIVALGPGDEQNVYVENTPLPGTILVHKFEDRNDNGRADAGEERAGWTFDVTGPGVRVPKATTNESGIAQFVVDFKSDAGSPCEPKPQKFTIHEVPEDGYLVQPDQEVNLGPDGFEEMTFLNRIPPVNLLIQKFYDANRNGVLDAGEDDGTRYDLENWDFEVAYQGGVETYQTDADGRISVSLAGAMPEATCTIREIISQTERPGWICTTANPQQVKVSSRNPDILVRFGNRVNRIEIPKFNDSNFNARRDDGEAGLPGWNFELIAPDGSIIRAGPTNGDGVARKEGLLPGTYVVREVLQDGWINTTPLSVSAEVRAGEDAIVSPPRGNIKSSRIVINKFNDSNRNEVMDSDESGLQGWNFTVMRPDGAVLTVGPTNTEGVVSLEGLTPGVYIVTENLIEGWLNTTPLSRRVDLSIGESESVSFGNYYCTRCHRITDAEKPPVRDDGDLKVIKEVSNLSTENMDRANGNVVNYNITICPSRSIEEIAAIPTDIVIAVDNSKSIENMRESAIGGVRELADDIKANDPGHVTRIGLVSWSDESHSGEEVDLTDNYTEVSNRADEIKFAEGNFTNYGVGLVQAVKAFDEASVGKEKKIVIITDASDSGYIRPDLANIDLSGYSVFAIVVGDNRETNASAMLNDLTRRNRGYVIPIKDMSELGEALVKTATAGSLIKNVHLVEVLPNYLVLLNSTATHDGGLVRLNGDSPDWTTTTITWDIGELSGCWSTDFQAVFCWKLPADVDQPALSSYVNYTDEEGMSRSIALPEHEINILSGTEVKPAAASEPVAVPEKEAPGFEALFAAVGISLAGYLCRRRGD